MQFYLAPLEGITGYLYRNALHDFFGGEIDKYFTPFLTPHTKRSFSGKEKNDLMREHNPGISLVPQVLTKSALDFLHLAEDLKESFGYTEVDINLGCPSGTVTSKGRGAGFLAKPRELDEFLQEIFAKTTAEISLKTRIGTEDCEEFYQLLEIYNKYPLKELIIHPRLGAEYYKGTPHRDLFYYAMEHSRNVLCYNGDIFSKADMPFLQELGGHEKVKAVMLGRGILRNPGLVRELRTGERLKKEELLAFHDRILFDYQSTLSGDRNVLFKMKELWAYMMELFPDSEKYAKQIKKAERISEYRAAVEQLFLNRELLVDEKN